MGSDKCFLLTSTFVPKGLSALMYKSIKIYTRTRCQVSVYRTTGPLLTPTLESTFILYIFVFPVLAKIRVLSIFGCFSSCVIKMLFCLSLT